jgi:segregation and condensation protein B
MDSNQLKYMIEAALLAAGRPMGIDRLESLFGDDEPPAKQAIRAAIMELQSDYAERGIEVVEVGSGFRIQIRTNMAHQLEKLWDERPPRYSRALLETMAIIAYRQPVTRGEIEDIRGVAVSTNIVRTLLERNWIKVVGHRDVPGKPAMFGTTKEFLDYFGLKKLDDLPPLSELKDFDKLNIQLDLPGGDTAPYEVQADGADQIDDVDADAQRDNVSSLDDARAAAQDDDDVVPEDPVEEPVVDEQEPATVIPLKQP